MLNVIHLLVESYANKALGLCGKTKDACDSRLSDPRNNEFRTIDDIFK